MTVTGYGTYARAVEILRLYELRLTEQQLRGMNTSQVLARVLPKVQNPEQKREVAYAFGLDLDTSGGDRTSRTSE